MNPRRMATEYAYLTKIMITLCVELGADIRNTCSLEINMNTSHFKDGTWFDEFTSADESPDSLVCYDTEDLCEAQCRLHCMPVVVCNLHGHHAVHEGAPMFVCTSHMYL